MNVPKKSVLFGRAGFFVLGVFCVFVVSLMIFSISVTSAVTSSPLCDSGTPDTTCTITKPKVLNGEQVFNKLIIRKGGSLTHDANRDSISNFLKITATDVQIDAGGAIGVNGKGYAGGSMGSNGYGPGAGKSGASGSGAGYGNLGGRGSGSTPGEAYDTSVLDPTEAGSGGGGAVSGKKGVGGAGGAGGGLIFLTVTGTLTLNGVIGANGNPGIAGTSGSGAGGAGSGGTIIIKVGTFAGTGTISANGGASSGSPKGGGGAGGRIVVISGAKKYKGTPSVAGGAGLASGAKGSYSEQDLSKNLCDSGTPDTTCVISSPKTLNGEYTFNELIVDVGGVLTHDAQPKSSPKNSPQILKNSLKIYARELTIKQGGKIDVTGKGYAGGEGLLLGETNKAHYRGTGFGPGGGTPIDAMAPGGGGGHGWVGQPIQPAASTKKGPSGGGAAYDSYSNPLDAGSGGGASGGSGCCVRGAPGGAGGGVVLLTVDETLTVDGTISADGVKGSATGGSGAGGSINIVTHTLAGSGKISAIGGSGSRGGVGAGGRGAVRYSAKTYTGTYDLLGGSGNALYAGSLYEWDQTLPAPETDDGCGP